MEIEKEKEEEKNNEENEDENDIELLQKFSKHKNIKNKNNKNDIFIKCSFNKDTIDQNKNLLSQYEKYGIKKTSHYFALDKKELEDPIDPKKIKFEKNNNLFLFENDIENTDLYCGYIDHMNLQKIKNKDKSIISCPFCFNLISNSIIENKSDEGYVIIGKSKSIFKDFSSDVLNTEKASKLFKDDKGIKNYEKKIKREENNNDNEINKEENNIEDVIMEKDEKKYVIISCINCGNIIGLCDVFYNTKIIFDYI